MAFSMSTQLNRTHWRYAFLALAAAGSLICAASCLSGDDAPSGGRVEHPHQRAPIPVTSADGAEDVSHPPPGGPFSPLDQEIADDCPLTPGAASARPRAWSKNVPDRDCTKDSECGDGFCDRGHCATIWTCHARYGQRCENGRAVRSRWFAGTRCSGICLEGRCRSCRSDEECVEASGYSGVTCSPVSDWGSGRSCGVLGPDYGRR